MTIKFLTPWILFTAQIACAFSHTIPTIEATSETDPIPYSTKDTDDAAIWFNQNHPEKSLILGTSKVTPTGDRKGGLGIYDLMGHEQEFLYGDKLNNVDTLTAVSHLNGGPVGWAVASNRTAKALDLFAIHTGGNVSKDRTIPLVDARGQSITPYGLCTAHRLGHTEVFLPTKTGVLYRFRLSPNGDKQATLIDSLDLASYVTREDDDFIKSIVEKTARAENELEKLPEMLAERFILEACAYQKSNDRLFVGMENFGIWSIDLRSKSKKAVTLFQKISGSWTDIDTWSHEGVLPRITDDIEGMDVFRSGDHDYLIVSSQGISEFNIFDLDSNALLGNFKIQIGSDQVTATDGVAVFSAPLSPALPEGVLVVHDDINTNPDGIIENANYKIVSLKKIIDTIVKSPK